MPTETNVNARRVKFTPDGEALDFTDMINMQLFQRAHEANMLLSSGISNGAGIPANPGTIATPESFDAFNAKTFDTGGVVLTPTPGAAFVQAGGAANQLVITQGPIIVPLSELWLGGGEEMGVYRVGAALTLTTAAGDATNPRIDLVEVKVEYIDGAPTTRHFEDAVTRAPSSQAGTNKERQARLTYQIKQGAPAPGPVYPTPTAGFVAMAAVFVPANHNAVHSPTNIRDLRMPLGCRAIDVLPREFVPTGVNPWILSGHLMASQVASNVNDKVYAVCPVASKTARLIALGLYGYPGAAPAAKLVRLTYAGNAQPTITQIAAVAPYIYPATTQGLQVADLINLYDAFSAQAAIIGIRAAGTRIGTPVWCNGQPGGIAHPGVAYQNGYEAGATKLAVEFSDEVNARVAFVRFWIADGL